MSQASTPARAASPGFGETIDRLVRAASPSAVAAGVFALLMALVLSRTLNRGGGTFSYTLDDPYIHLALAERIAQGHYGINFGEVTSPSSSVIWPFLMLPGVGTWLHPYMPLLMNFVFGLAAAWLLGRFAAALPLPLDDRTAPYTRIALAVLLVIGTNQVGLAYTGMEHNLQVLLAIVAALGLVEHLRGKPLPVWAIAAAALGPAVRYEMFAITAAVGFVLLVERRWRLLAALSLGCLALPVALSAFLYASGNHPLPNSVLLKLSAIPKPDALPFPLDIILPRNWNVNIEAKLVTWGMIAAVAVGAMRARGGLRLGLAAVTAAGLLHMLLGRFGWFYRYEIYIVAFLALPALWLAAGHVPRYVAVLAVPLAALYVTPITWSAAASQNITEQQLQMRRFIAEHYKKPFAVNDLGWVSYRMASPVYVLDLWGLASNEALVKARSRTPAWLDDITRRHGTGLAMIYDEWFPEVPASWTKVADLVLAGPQVTAAADTVQIYATAAGDKAEIARHLRAFEPTLPPGVTLRWR